MQKLWKVRSRSGLCDIFPPFALLASTILVCHCAVKVYAARKEEVVPNHEARLFSDLFRDYNRNARPISDVRRSVVVSIAFYLTKILALDEKNQILTTFGWLEVKWKDDFLIWDPEDYGSLQRIIVPPQFIWLPDFGLENSAEAIYDDQADRKFRAGVDHDGWIQWVPGGRFVTSCQLDITYYPFDSQMCEMDFVDWTYDGRFVTLVNGSDEIALSVFRTHGEWQVTKTRSLSLNQQFDSDPGISFPTVKFQLFLQRKPKFYMINIVAPCILMSILDLLVFYLPPDSGEKVSLGITVLLSFSVFLLLIAENVPKTSDCVPLIGIYLTMVMVMTASSIVASVLVLELHHHDPTTPVPPLLRRIIIDTIGRRLCLIASGRRPPPNRKSDHHQHQHHRQHHQHNNHRQSGSMRSNSTLPYLTGDDEYQHRRTSSSQQQYVAADNGVKGFAQIRKINTTENVVGLMQVNDVVENNSVAVSSSAISVLNEILANVRFLAFRLRQNGVKNDVRDEWKLVARVFDRLMLLLFVAAICTLTLAILYFYPTNATK